MPPRSPIATAGRGTPICTPMSRSRTRCRPRRTLAVCRWACVVQGQCCRLGGLQQRARTASPRHVRRVVRRTARHRSGGAADPRDPRHRPATEPALADPPRPHQHPPQRPRDPVPARSWRPADPVEALHLAQQATLETRDAKHEPRSLTEATRDVVERGGSSARAFRRRAAPRRRPSRHLGLHRVPEGGVAANLVQQSPRTVQSNPPPHRRRRHLPPIGPR